MSNEPTSLFDVFTNPRERIEVLLESYLRGRSSMNLVAIALESILSRLREFKADESYMIRDYSRYLDCCISNEMKAGKKAKSMLATIGKFLKIIPSCNEKKLKRMSINLLKLIRTNDGGLELSSASTTATIFSGEYVQCPRCDEVWIAREDESPIICPKCALSMHNPSYKRLEI